jgi:4-amino-4-deoxy-L-arabinose transferase-like glycosyltransferase
MMSVHRPRSTPEWALITLILLVAALLRFYDLGNVPKGLEHDEVATWHMVNGVLQGERPIYFEEGYGHEPLFNYLTALPVSILGNNWLGERFWAPWFGLLAVAATYALMRRMFGPLVGLGAAGLQATVLWALFFNRLGLRLNQLPLLLCLAVYCFWRGIESIGSKGPGVRVAWFAGAGAFAGLCFYTYMSSRVVPLILGAFSAYLIARDRWIVPENAVAGPTWRALAARWWPLLACVVVAGLVMAPLALYLANRPIDTLTPQREGQVDRPLQELLRGDPRAILQNAWALIKMWNWDGERYWQLNYAHRPVFVEPISGTLFWLGALLALWRWRDPRMALLAIWVGLGMVPSLVTSEAPSWPRTMLASPAALALPALAAAAAHECLSGTLNGPHILGPRARARCASLARFAAQHRWVRALPGAVLALSLLLTAALTYRDFLVVWPANPRVRYAFQSSLTEALRYLDAQDDISPVVMSGLSPHDMDPWTERCTLRRRDLAIRWVDTRSALVLPPGDAFRLIVLDITPVDPVLASWAGLSTAQVLGMGPIVPRGGAERDVGAPVFYDPSYAAYQLDVARLQDELESAPYRAFVGSDPFDPQEIPAAPEFGGLVRLRGYRWMAEFEPGATVPLLTFWSALDTGPSSTIYGEPALRTFVHLLDRSGAVVSGMDALGAAPDTWVAGDVIVQLVYVSLPAEAGTYAVEVGWYVPPQGPRLPVDGIDAPGERILLEPVEVGR